MIKYIILSICIFISACSYKAKDKIKLIPEKEYKEPKQYLSQADYNDLTGWYNDDHKVAFISFLRSCDVINKIPADKSKTTKLIESSYADWQSICEQAKKIIAGKSSSDIYDEIIGNDAAREFFENNFTPFVIKVGHKDEGMFTGYYLPVLNGSYKKTSRYTYPIYSIPDEAHKNYSREKIENGALEGKGLEIIWVDDKIELFFLHIQGSGIVMFEDGSMTNIGYAGQNGHKYYAIGHYLIKEGEIDKDKMSAEAIKSWLRNNPDKAEFVMNKNPSYIYFRNLGKKDIVGAENSVITARRTLAIDNRYLPYGIPLWLEVKTPNMKGEYDKEPFHKLMIAQDKGGAIKGLVRGDIFFGVGKNAEIASSHMKGHGKYYLLIPDNIAVKNNLIK